MLEREPVPGGRAGVFAEAGFHIDTGPTMLTMPELLRATFAAAGAEIDRYVTIEPLDPMYRATFADGSVLHVRHGREDMAAEIREFSGGRDAAAFGEFCDMARRDVRDRDADLHRHQLRRRVAGRTAMAARLADAPQGRLQALRLDGWRRSSRTSACSACSASSRSKPASRRTTRWRCSAVRTYMDERRRRVHRTRRHARRRRPPWRGRSPTPVRRSGTTRR